MIADICGFKVSLAKDGVSRPIASYYFIGRGQVESDWVITVYHNGSCFITGPECTGNRRFDSVEAAFEHLTAVIKELLLRSYIELQHVRHKLRLVREALDG